MEHVPADLVQNLGGPQQLISQVGTKINDSTDIAVRKCFTQRQRLDSAIKTSEIATLFVKIDISNFVLLVKTYH